MIRMALRGAACAVAVLGCGPGVRSVRGDWGRLRLSQVGRQVRDAGW